MNALAKAAAQGDSKREQAYLALLEKAEYQQSIIDAISKPAEGKPWKLYRPIFLTTERLGAGLAFWRENAELLAAVEEKYKVPAEYIVAIIGVETFYGRNTGKYRVLDALTTLGLYYAPRQTFFAGELTQFLRFSEIPRIKIDPLAVRGSYAGAMGLGQFIPSSYVNFATDGNGDGMVDLWAERSDVIASVANYFAVHGWEAGGPVVAKVKVAPHARNVQDAGVEPVYPVRQLQEWGYTPKGKFKAMRLASLLQLDGEKGWETYASFKNFYVITRYNRSPLYAMAVHQFAQQLKRDFKTRP